MRCRCFFAVPIFLFSLIVTPFVFAADGQNSATDAGFVRIKGGCFQMGQFETEKETLERLRSPFSAEVNFGDELPRHEVCVSDYSLGSHEVTVAEFRLFVEDTGYLTEAEQDGGCMEYRVPGYRWNMKKRNWQAPGFSQQENEPVVCVSYNDALEYARWLSEKDGNRKYRLPTEAEWEFAVREGGSDTVYGNSNEVTGLGWYVKNSPRRTRPVGTQKVNSLGVSDLFGNVWEWTGDTYGQGYYAESPKQDPTGPEKGKFKVVRGGGWNSFSWRCRAANREYALPVHRDTSMGFRLAFTK